MIGLVVAVCVLLAATVFGLMRRRSDGVLSSQVPDEAAGARGRDAGTGPATVDLSGMGAQPGQRATLLQFSSAFCATCRATRRILDEVAGMVDGVAHVEIDAESHLDLVRRLNIMRTPTVLILDGGGRIMQRAVGQPRKADVIAALGHVIP